MSLNDYIQKAKQDLHQWEDDFVKEIVEKYYPHSLQNVGGNPEDAALDAVDSFLEDMADGRSEEFWKNSSFVDPLELLSDPTVLEYSFNDLPPNVPNTIKEALEKIVSHLTHEALVLYAEDLEAAVLQAVNY